MRKACVIILRFGVRYVTRIWGNSLLRSFLLLSLIEWKTNIVYHRHWHWPHYYHRSIHCHTLTLSRLHASIKHKHAFGQFFCVWSNFRWFFFCAIFLFLLLFVYVCTVLFFIWPFVHAKVFFASRLKKFFAWMFIGMCLWANLFVSLCHHSWNQRIYLFFPLDFLLYSLLSPNVIVIGNISRFHRKLCTTR